MAELLGNVLKLRRKKSPTTPGAHRSARTEIQ